MAKVERKEIFGWAMFDFANSSYTTVIVTVVYSIVFPKLIVGDGPTFERGNFLWAIALSIAYLLVVATAPLLGALMDYRAAKKRFLFASWLLTILSTAALGLAGPGDVALAMTLVVISNFGFATGESFIASFLPDLAPPEALGKISGLAWGLGYVGGLASTIGVLTIVGEQVAENFLRLRLIGPSTALFFALAAIPTFLFVKERGTPKVLPPGKTLLSAGLDELRLTLRELPRLRDLSLFFASLLFAMAGLGIVISFAFIYGDQVIGWKASTQVAMFVLTNLSAAVGAVLFGVVQDRLGNVRTYRLTLLVWVLAVVGIHQTTTISDALGGVSRETVYLGVGVIAGLCLGATQSAGRTIVALFAPDDRVGQMFGFWGMAGKLAQAAGLVGLGAMQAALGLSNAILLCAVFFGIAFVLAWRCDEKRGRAAAREPPTT
jgi:MFS transporter, UMF1 family